MMTERQRTARAALARWWSRIAPRIGPGLRVIAGVDERLLGRIPSERSRYTALGGVVLGTACIAGLSMWFALSEVSGGVGLGAAIGTAALAGVWSLFVLTVDRWLITSTSGRWWRRVPMLLPRLMIALVLGVVIAEPIVLRIFESAVEEHVLQQRADHLDDLRGNLVRCNPVPGEAAVPASGVCVGYVLSFATDPSGVVGQLTAARADRDNLRRTADDEAAESNRLRDLAEGECVGATGPNLSGRPGRGPECLEREQAAEAYTAAHPAAARQAQLSALDARIADLERVAGTGGDDYRRLRDQQITTRVDKERSSQQEIGLLERFEALDALTVGSGFLSTATWFVRLFLVLVDVLPVLVKFFGGVTAYDRLVEQEVGAASRVHAHIVETAELETTEELATRAEEVRETAQRHRAQVQHESRLHRDRMEAEVDDEVDRRHRAARARRRDGGWAAEFVTSANGTSAGEDR